MYENFPKELKNQSQWVCAKNKSKVPLTIHGKAASSADKNTWSTFDEACAAVECGKVDAVGYVFNNSGIVGIDLDKCIGADGFLSPLACDILKRCKSYTEYSRSGKGVHIYLRGQLPFGGRNNGNDVEIYQTGRFFIVTGRKLIYDEIIENQEAIDYVVNTYFPDVAEAISSNVNIEALYKPTYHVICGEKITIKTIYQPIAQGCRNVSLTSLAGHLRNHGYTKKALLHALTEVNNKYCDSPLPKRELVTIVNSIIRYTSRRG
jgi:hypothetical protein